MSGSLTAVVRKARFNANINQVGPNANAAANIARLKAGLAYYFPTKSPAEDKTVGVDLSLRNAFTNDLVDNSVPQTVFVRDTDLTISCSTPSFDGSWITTVVSGGLPTMTYEIVFGYTTLSGQVVEQSILLPVDYK